LALFICCSFFFFKTNAEQLSVKTYTIADGLARDYVNRIKQDSHGFIWFCTSEGISRFDGYTFTNYGIADGLPHRFVADFMETRDGDYLFATNGGLVQFNPTGKNSDGSHFTVIKFDEKEASKFITKLVEDKDGTIWCGTAEGLYRVTKASGGWQSVFMDKDLTQGNLIPAINTLVFDREGSLWIGTPGSGLYRRFQNGNIERYTIENGLSQNGISKLLLDRDGRIWVGTGFGLTLLVKEPRQGEKIGERIYRVKDGLLNDFISSLYQSSDGRIWVGTRGGLNLLVEPKDNNGSSFLSYTTAHGLRNIKIWDITGDSDGNLWLGAESGGVMKIPQVGFTSYFETDGLGNGRISQIFSDREGNVYFLANAYDSLVPVLGRFNGHGFVKETPNLPFNTQTTWGWNQLILQDHLGDWWIPTDNGIFRFSGNKSFSELADSKPTRIYRSTDGMNGNAVFRLFEDVHGDLWFSTLDGDSRSIHHWERSSDKMHLYPPDESIPAGGPTAFANDGNGNLWVGFYSGGLARYSNRQFVFFSKKEGILQDLVRGIFLDSKKRLWVATNGGLIRIDNPLAEKPQFVILTMKDGLSSNQITTVTEDKWGQIYLGTGRGIDRLDPETKIFKHFTTADGLSDNFVNVSMRDAQGALWFGTLRGLSRFVPEQDNPHSPPSILISSLRIAGEKQIISELGETEVVTSDLSYTQNQLQIDFVSLSFASGDVVRYQYKFEGSGNDWSAPTEQRTVTLPNLPPSSYRFLVRAINSDGVASSHPASVNFRILPPVWKRWWFIALSLFFVGLIGFIFVRSRLQTIKVLQQAREERLRELERVRTRIATDLHDDIGSSLTQIAVLSEVAQQTSNGNNTNQNVEPLQKISRVSNELVDTMSDIVWALTLSI